MEVSGSRTRCHIDGKLVTEATDTSLSGARRMCHGPTRRCNGRCDLEAGERRRPRDVNSIDEPINAVFTEIKVNNAAASFAYECSAYAVNVLRLKRGNYLWRREDKCCVVRRFSCTAAVARSATKIVRANCRSGGPAENKR
jgi:hypothetical protein